MVAAAVGLIALLLVQGLAFRHQTSELATVKQQWAERQRQLSHQKALVQPKADDGQDAEKTRRMAELALDLNPLFDAVERVRIAGVTVQNLEYDQGRNGVTVRFQLDNVEKAPLVTVKLNQGLKPETWRLQQIALSAGVKDGNSQPLDGLGRGGYTGIWLAVLP